MLLLTGLLLGLTPLIFSGNTNELFEFPKMFFVYRIGSVLIGLFLIHRIFYTKKITGLILPIILWLLSYFASTIFSMHFYTSLWGYYTRFNGGFVSFAIYFGVFLAFSNTFDKRDIEFFLNLLLLTLIPISIYGIYQFYSLNVVRVYSTLGQANWLAAYISMLIPIAIYKLFTEKDILKKRLYYFMFVISYYCLWLTFSMSGLLALFTGIITVCIINNKIIFVKRNTGLIAITAVLFVLISVFNPGIFLNRIYDLKVDFKNFLSEKAVVHALEPAHKISDPGFIRISIWKGVIDLSLYNTKIFTIGTGPSTFPYIFYKFRPGSLNYSSEWDYIFNKPHNYYLELLSETGIVGVGFYFLVIIHTLRKKHAYLTSCFIAFYTANFFGWPTVATNLLFWIFIGFYTLEYD